MFPTPVIEKQRHLGGARDESLILWAFEHEGLHPEDLTA